MAQLSLRNVYKNYGDVKVVKDFNLEIADREFVVFVGPSGCGKSTTLRMIAGLEEISDGEIYIGDRLVNNVAPKDRDIAMVFQNYALYPHMNVYENMAFGLKLRKFSKQEIDKRVKQAAEILGLSHLLGRKPKELSGGQRQRVALGRAIVREPAVFLMDEPLSNLDAKLRVQMRTELSKLHNRLQTTTIYVTHDQVEAMTMGTRIVVMKDGIVQQVAPPQDLYDHPNNLFVAGFIGSPAMNFLKGTISADGNVFDGGTFKVNLPENLVKAAGGNYNGKKVVLGVRPEDVNADQDSLQANQGSKLTAKVDVVEPLGAEIFLYLSTGENTITARVEPNLRFKVGQEVELALTPSMLHLFDAETEQAIR
ncbi:MAG TPA: sn-glycerol-3-phosphate ABC transporter ATP-binding protein UgpC [Symbiobacteriaceae bacterium]|nr:sn-glycerol-3-phosphate ABC transporter ATP-binding protein UgpC [Symbiobacteriaceae bacterium]